VPLFIYLLKKNLALVYPFLIILSLVCTTVIGLQVYISKTGVSPAFDLTYRDLIYTKPWQHFTGMITLGVGFGMFFNEYIEKRKRIDQGDRHENSVSYTLLKYIKKKVILRIVINIIGIGLMAGTSVLAWAYMV
jgi:hypothetical protein